MGGQMSINKELAKKWVAALRSGEYKQTGNVLRNLDGFCCLGVLCDILDSGKWNNNKRFIFFDELDDNKLYESGTEIPNTIWYNMFGNTSSQNLLIDMNDLGASSFYEIADYVETTLGLAHNV